MGEPERGAQALSYLVRSLPVVRDVLCVGAHPDDEEPGLIAMLAHGYGARVVYWSATRGEGGQSRVVPYTGRELGVYRTWESLAARAVDGGESLFGPFYDFGYSKNGAEALQKWGETELVAELVRAIRAVQPQLVVSRWRGDASDGHGHHAAVGTAVRAAFLLAGDARHQPELHSAGLTPWQPRKLYHSMTEDWQPGESVELGALRQELDLGDGYTQVNLGAWDPVSGRTFHEQGVLAHNEHLTQGTTHVPTTGDHYLYYRLIQVAPESGLDAAIGLFDGLDGTLAALADYPGGGHASLREGLTELSDLAGAAADALNVADPRPVGEDLLALVQRFRQVEQSLPRLGLETAALGALSSFLVRKRRAAESAAAICLGLRLEASVDRAALTPGESVRLTARLRSDGAERPATVDFHPSTTVSGAAVARRVDVADGEAVFDITLPATAELSSPYWLRHEPTPYAYTWPPGGPAAVPFDPPPFTVACTTQVAGTELTLSASAPYKEAFAGGYRELTPAILPPISVQPEVTRCFLRRCDVAQRIELSFGLLGHRAAGPIAGVLDVDVPPGWTVQPERIPIELARAGEAQSIAVTVSVPADTRAGANRIRWGVRCGERVYDSSISAVMQAAPGLDGGVDEGSCQQRVYIADRVAVDVNVIDVAVHDQHRYAYASGIRDEVAQILRGLALSVDVLTDADLAHGDLSCYDTIVIGPNAFVVRDGLRKASQRLLSYVHDGGTLITQYQAYPFAGMRAAPYPFSYNQPHDRVTSEGSPVSVLEPDHVLFRFPNRIDDADFSGWVRDRGMYFFGQWDAAYQPMLACADPGEEPKRGGLLFSRYGRGLYVYCGYSLFRQLAAGVPGAFRLFANLLALPEGRIRQRMEHLRSVPLFAELDDAQLHRVAEVVTERSVASGEYLCHQGDEGKEMYLILRGALDVLFGERDRYLRTCLPGEPIGELAAFTGLTRTASLRAQGDTEVLVMSSKDVLALMREQSDLAERMIQLLARRLYDALS